MKLIIWPLRLLPRDISITVFAEAQPADIPTKAEVFLYFQTLFLKDLQDSGS